MFAEQVDGGHEVIAMEGYLDETRILAAGMLIRARAVTCREQVFVLDFAGVTGFSGRALMSLDSLIREIREAGSQLVIRNLSKRLHETVTDRLLEELFDPALAAQLKAMTQISRTIARKPAPSYLSTN
jgi:anti-anti-sigma regulatory factor